MIGDNFGGQGSNSYRLFNDEGTALPRFPEWPQDKLEQAEYISFYPNVLLGIQADHVFVLIIEPVAHDKLNLIRIVHQATFLAQIYIDK
jgi:choline monooxygenase